MSLPGNDSTRLGSFLSRLSKTFLGGAPISIGHLHLPPRHALHNLEWSLWILLDRRLGSYLVNRDRVVQRSIFSRVLYLPSFSRTYVLSLPNHSRLSSSILKTANADRQCARDGRRPGKIALDQAPFSNRNGLQFLIIYYPVYDHFPLEY